MVQKTILIYGITGMELLSLTSMAEKAGIRVLRVTDRDTALTVGQLLSGRTGQGSEALPLMGRFALLSGFQGQEQMATLLINRCAPGVIKAVHTPTNTGWSFSGLCAAIGAEHRSLSGR